MDKLNNLGKEIREMCKAPRQDSGHSTFSKAKYAEKLFTQIYRDLYGDAMLVPINLVPRVYSAFKMAILRAE